MARSLKKGPFIDESLMKKIEKLNELKEHVDQAGLEILQQVKEME